MYAPTAKGMVLGCLRAQPQMTDKRPKVATNSPRSCPTPDRSCVDAKSAGLSNIKFAAATPTKAPASCARMYVGTSRHGRPPWLASAKVTAGLKCAPLVGPNVRMSATRPAPVASVLAKRASPTLPAASFSAMMTEPTTVARRSAVPRASEVARRLRLAAAATARLASSLVLNNGYAASGLGGALLHQGRLALDYEDLPRVSVRVFYPDLVLKRVAALGVPFGERLEPCFFEPSPGGRDVFAARDLDAEVAGIHSSTRRLLHREIQIRLEQV